MTFLKFLRKFITKNNPKPPLAYVQEARNQVPATTPDPEPATASLEIEHEIDLSGRTDLEDYARGLGASKKSIERWISSGLLMPEELKVAEKLLKIMNKN